MTRNSLKLFCIGLLLAGCATHYAPEEIADPFGFFSGLWHGIIFPFSLMVNIVSWLIGLLGISFFDKVQIIGEPNTGFWYYVGFAFGLLSYGGASGANDSRA